jgi:hypothetical protein
LTDDSIIKTFKLIKDDPRISIAAGRINYPNGKKYLTANNKPTFLTGLFEFTNLKKVFPNNKYSKNFWIEKDNVIKKPIPVSWGVGGAILNVYKAYKKNVASLDELKDDVRYKKYQQQKDDDEDDK